MASSRRTRARAWLRRWVANPIASVVLVGALTADCLSLPRHLQPTWFGLQVNRAVELIRGKPFITGCILPPPPDELYWIADDRQPRLLNPRVESWDELSAMLTAGDPPVARCNFFDVTFRKGIWAHTIEYHSRGITVQPLQGNWPERKLAAVRNTIFDASEQQPPAWSLAQHWADVEDDDLREVRVLWGGVLHSGIALSLFVALIYSCTGWRSWLAAHPWSKRSRRLVRGHCPDCGYDLSGNTTGICPECGQDHSSP